MSIDPFQITPKQYTRAEAMLIIQSDTSDIVEQTFKAFKGTSIVSLALDVRNNLVKHFTTPDINVKVDTLDKQRMLIKVDSPKVGKVTLKVKRNPSGIWGRELV